MAFVTRRSLLSRVHKGDEISWQEFYDTYKPLILLCGKDCYLSNTENDELVQQVMTEVFKKDITGKFTKEPDPDNTFFKYDPAKGRFRHYFRGLIRNQAMEIIKKRNNNPSFDDTDHPVKTELQDDSAWDDLWEKEWQKHVLTMAMQELKERVDSNTYVAFEMYAIQNKTVKEVQDLLNISSSSIYVAKNRCVETLKKIITELNNE